MAILTVYAHASMYPDQHMCEKETRAAAAYCNQVFGTAMLIYQAGSLLGWFSRMASSLRIAAAAQ